MSQPSFPKNDPSRTREDVINQILSSIAMEELGLSHIINTEGEKLQYALGTLEGVTGPDEPASIDDLLELNKSIRDTLDSTMQNQMLLKSKLQNALAASVMIGPTGEQGPQGADGATPSFAVEAVEPLEPGETPEVILIEDQENPNKWLFTFKIPGSADGSVPEFEVKDTESLEPGKKPEVILIRDGENPNKWLFTFKIPKGEKGDAGPEGRTATIDVGTVTQVPFAASPTVTNVGSNTDAIFNFELSAGPEGPTEPVILGKQIDY